MSLPELTDEKHAWYILQGYVIRVYVNRVAGLVGWREWVLNEKLHREDGPSLEWEDGTKKWYLDGIRMSEEEHRIAIQKLREERYSATS